MVILTLSIMTILVLTASENNLHPFAGCRPRPPDRPRAETLLDWPVNEKCINTVSHHTSVSHGCEKETKLKRGQHIDNKIHNLI